VSPRDEARTDGTTEDDGAADAGGAADAESRGSDDGVAPDIPRAPAVKTFDTAGTVDVDDAVDADGTDDETEVGEDLPDVSEVDDETLRAFVACVIYANAALLFVALGPMVWFFEGRRRIGMTLLVVGVLAGFRTYQTYRAWDRSRDDGSDPDGDTTATDRDATTTDRGAATTDRDATTTDRGAATVDGIDPEPGPDDEPDDRRAPEP
jgi:hypothetical protein